MSGWPRQRTLLLLHPWGPLPYSWGREESTFPTGDSCVRDQPTSTTSEAGSVVSARKVLGSVSWDQRSVWMA